MAVYPSGPQDSVKYTMTAPDGNVATFNDPTDANYVGMAWFSGLEGPDIREAIDVRAGSDGAVQGLNFRGARPVVGNVQIVASNTADRNIKSQRLRRATNALGADGTLDFQPDGGLASRVYFRLNQPLRRADERGWLYTYQWGMMAADPYIYSQTQRTSGAITSSPWQATLVNQGDGYAAPTFNITMNAASPVTVANLTTGRSVNLTTLDPTNLVSYVSKIGTAGTGNNQFNGPHGVAIDSSDNVYVADRSNHRIKKFNNAGVWQQTIGSGPGTGDGNLSNPIDVAVDASGNIFVSDGGHPAGGGSTGRIQKFNAAGSFQAKNTVALEQAHGLCLDSTGNVFAVDLGGDMLRKYANTLGAVTASFGTGTPGSATNQFNNPTGVACDASNQPWVVDYSNKRVMKLNTSLAYVAQYNMSGADGPSYTGYWGQTPYGITFDSGGNFYVSDGVSAQVAKFNSAGTYLTKFGSYGTGDGQFDYPYLLECRGTNLWVPDTPNNRVQQFSVASGSGTITLTHGTASVTGSTGLNLYSYVNVPTTNWWALAPGDNLVQVTGAVTSYTATWRDAWL